jgi:hypothetical protein
MSICVLIPYFKLLTDRARTIDTDQALEVTRQPDLLRVSEIVGILIVLVLVWLAKKRYTSWQLPSFIFALSSATLPIIVFQSAGPYWQIAAAISLRTIHRQLRCPCQPRDYLSLGWPTRKNPVGTLDGLAPLTIGVVTAGERSY